jgi:hypothetical protein
VDQRSGQNSFRLAGLPGRCRILNVRLRRWLSVRTPGCDLRGRSRLTERLSCDRRRGRTRDDGRRTVGRGGGARTLRVPRAGRREHHSHGRFRRGSTGDHSRSAAGRCMSAESGLPHRPLGALATNASRLRDSSRPGIALLSPAPAKTDDCRSNARADSRPNVGSHSPARARDRRRRVNRPAAAEDSSHRRIRRQLRHGSIDWNGDWKRRVETASGNRDWKRRLETASGNGDWKRRVETAAILPFVLSIRPFHSPFPFALSNRRFHPPFPVAVWQRVSRSFRPLCHAAILRPEKPERIPINQLFP